VPDTNTVVPEVEPSVGVSTLGAAGALVSTRTTTVDDGDDVQPASDAVAFNS
jgi:hypothetical protein